MTESYALPNMERDSHCLPPVQRKVKIQSTVSTGCMSLLHCLKVEKSEVKPQIRKHLCTLKIFYHKRESLSTQVRCMEWNLWIYRKRGSWEKDELGDRGGDQKVVSPLEDTIKMTSMFLNSESYQSMEDKSEKLRLEWIEQLWNSWPASGRNKSELRQRSQQEKGTDSRDTLGRGHGDSSTTTGKGVSSSLGF